jgi:exosortase E/protease (VPEID-CTERM system)
MNSHLGSTGESYPQSTPFFVIPQHILGRLYLLAALVAAEGVFVVGALRVGPALHSHLARIVIVAFGVFLTLGYTWLKDQREAIPFGSFLFGGYLFCLAFGSFFRALSSFHGAGFFSSHAEAFATSPLLLLRIPLLFLACIPLRTWIKTLRDTSPLWLYASLAGVAAWALTFPIKLLWLSETPSYFSQAITFSFLAPVLRLCLPGLVADAGTFTIGTPHFSVIIAPGCSGLEGLGLVLVFTTVWLWYSRKECRFPHALLFIPCALVCIWLLNIVRLCILIVIGDRINPEIALVGIHSKVGWIAFIVVALGFFLATQRLSWVRKEPSSVLCEAGHPEVDGFATIAGAPKPLSEDRGESPAIRAYLIPFLAILAASFVSKAASGYFEWLYPLRFAAAVAALWLFRVELKKLNWRIGWMSPLAGLVIFLVWIAPSWWAHQRAASPLGPALAALSPSARWAWISIRVAAAVVTVPIAEELAFRGYLARRFISQEFDGVSFSSLTVLPVAFSSVVFGMMHMQNLGDWSHLMVGTLAGIAYAVVLRWRGRMGDAVAAHAISNLLLAVWVLGLGDWAQW